VNEHDENLWRIAKFIEPTLSRAEFMARIRAIRRRALLEVMVSVVAALALVALVIWWCAP
jgi:hypothetical protein